MANNIHELHTHLFETLRGLKSGTVNPELARAINDTAQTIINAAKVEVNHMKVAGGVSAFVTGNSESPRIERTADGARRQNSSITARCDGNDTQDARVDVQHCTPCNSTQL
ncbi:hypothetical protein FACS1894116_12670 [Betaproteobacteria bacterium]|nr:hypothetical protein FACS1894116_12670 [Betaproteobacteria bacterium]